MLAIFESIVPIFALIVAGNLLRRLPMIDKNTWPGLEQLAFWFLYPALLMSSIARADFSNLEIGPLLYALLSAIAIAAAATLLAWPLLRTSGLVARAQYSTVFQCTVRWNGFIALAIAEKLYGAEGAAVVALAMAVIIIPINLSTVLVVSWFAETAASWKTLGLRMATNPLVIGALLGLAIRLLPDGLYGPADVALNLVARAALGMGLITIGAGLKPNDMFKPSFALWLPVIVKLTVFPALLVGIAILFGITGQGLVYLALCGSVPTAMNGYLVAKQMGGDAPLYAATATLQTVVSFISIPIVLALAGQLAAG